MTELKGHIYHRLVTRMSSVSLVIGFANANGCPTVMAAARSGRLRSGHRVRRTTALYEARYADWFIGT